jgi:hypothetical protein
MRRSTFAGGGYQVKMGMTQQQQLGPQMALIWIFKLIKTFQDVDSHKCGQQVDIVQPMTAIDANKVGVESRRQEMIKVFHSNHFE